MKIRSRYIAFVFMLVFLVGFVRVVYSADCGDTINLSHSANPQCGATILLTLRDYKEIDGFDCGTYKGVFGTDGCWNDGNYQNATLSLPNNLTNSTSAIKTLNPQTRYYNWNLNCNSTGLYVINVTLENSTGTCQENITLNITSWATNPTLSIKFPTIPDNFTIGQSYSFNITINNTGNENATSITGNLVALYATMVNVTNGTINISKIVNGSWHNVTLNISFLQGGDTYVKIYQLDYYRSSGVYYSYASGQSNTFHINYNPSLTQIPNISVLINTSSTLELDGYHEDLDAYDDDSNVNYTWSGNSNVNITLNATSRIFNFSAPDNWTGAENISLQAKDLLNATTNVTFTVFVYNSSAETCDGTDEDGDTLTDENSANSGSLTQSCCPSSCSSNGIQTCANGSWSGCAGYAALSSGGSGGSSGTSSIIKTETPKEPEKEKPTVKPIESKPLSVEEPPKSSGGSVKKEKTVQEDLIEKIANNRVKHTRTLQIQGGRTRVIETFKNIDIFDAEDVRVTLDIPKSIAKTTDEITEVTPFEIIEADPKIQFDLSTIKSREEKAIVYIIEKKLSPEDIGNIILKMDIKDIPKEEREELFNKTQEIINITTTAKVDEKRNETEFTLEIDFINDTILHDADIYMEIPKCLVQIIEEMTIDSDFKFDIVSRDPLIVWHFTKLEKGDQLKYIIRSIADEDCLNQVKTYAIARHIVLLEADFGSPESVRNKIIIPALSIFLLIIFLFLLASCLDKKKHNIRRLNKIINHAGKNYGADFGAKGLRDELVSSGFNQKEIEDADKHSKKHFITRFISRHIFGGEVLFLSILIIFNILDFFRFLPGDMDFLKKIISWTLLSYLLYKISLMKVLFGDIKFRKILDISLLIFFFSLIFKLIIEFASVSFNETRYYSGLLFLLAKYSLEATNISLYAGFIGLILVSFFITFFIPIGKPSFYYVATSIFGRHKISGKHIIETKIAKFFSVYLVLLLFYIIIYNFAFEWLAIAIDASILMVALTITLIIFIRREYHLLIYHKIKDMFRVRISRGIEKIANGVDSFNIKFFQLLPYRKFVYLAMIGILILHLATEAGIFIIPYVTGATNPAYFSELGEGHMPILNLIGPLQTMFHNEVTESLLSIQTKGISILNMITLIYATNIIAALFLLLNPLIIWLHMYKEREKPAHSVNPMKSGFYSLFQFLFVISILSLIFIPIFKIGFASNKILGGGEVDESISSIRGVDIQTHLIKNEQLPLIPWVLGVSILIGFFCLISRKKYYKQITAMINTVNLALILVYLIMFYMDIHRFFINTLSHLLHKNIFFFVHFALFFIISALFYLIGILLLGIELFVRGEIYLPVFAIRIIKPAYNRIENAYRRFLPHHHLPHLIFYEHYIEAERGQKEEHIQKHIVKAVEHIHKNEKMLKRMIEEGVKKEKHDLHFIEEHLLEHNWPKSMVENAIKKARKDPSIKEQLEMIKYHYLKIKALHKLTKSVQKYYNAGYPLDYIISYAKKKGWKAEDIRQAIAEVKVKRKDKKIKKQLLRA